ncbi:uncharacterized protein LOC110663581 [Hevea brasiliensis]|uniref:uncharacterized protein LOC110663581 n=1 Tax=Hevea brasiliensis TaxID=3981 RepID=UPI0025F7E9DC|nr:uncharacterized protein LOC110663581 [Hevea brasiliensis]
MAFRTPSHWRTMLTRFGEKRSFASATTPKFSRGVDNAHSARPAYNKYAMTGEFAPVYVVVGMVVVAISIGLHTVKQQLVHSPGVNITKKRRESVPEVDIPDTVAANGDKFINKSFLRKVAQIKDDKRTP